MTAPLAEQTWNRSDMSPGSFWMPQSASNTTDSVDWLFHGILGLSVFCFVAITIAVAYFTIKYRRRPGHKREDSRADNHVLEITWTVIPSIICAFIFVWGWQGFKDMRTGSDDAIEIRVVARTWQWQFEYPNGWINNTLHVPVNQKIRLVMRSEDVVHSFYVPAFRQKQDVLPGRYTTVWFEATEPGVYRVACAEFCGQQHWGMKTIVIVHPEGEYEALLAEVAEKFKLMPPVELGEYLYTALGCKQCHSIDGSRSTGPSFKGIWGQRHKFTDGTTGVVDANFIRQSILRPQAKIHMGFNAVMPTFEGSVEDKEIDGLIAYIRSLK